MVDTLNLSDDVNFLVMEFKERFESSLAKARINKTELCSELGIENEQNITHWIRRKGISKKWQFPVCDRLGVHIKWMQTGEGDRDITRYTLGQATESNIALPLASSGELPLISWVQAGNWCEAVDTFETGDAEAWYPCPVKHSKQSYILRVRGASMEPEYRDGDYIFIDPSVQPDHNSDVVVRLNHAGEATFKRLQYDGDRRYLQALNKSFPDPIIPLGEEAQICGVVIFSGRPR